MRIMSNIDSLSLEQIKMDLEPLFPEYRFSLQRGFIGQYIQVVKSSLVAVAIRIKKDGIHTNDALPVGVGNLLVVLFGPFFRIFFLSSARELERELVEMLKELYPEKQG